MYGNNDDNDDDGDEIEDRLQGYTLSIIRSHIVVSLSSKFVKTDNFMVYTKGLSNLKFSQ